MYNLLLQWPQLQNGCYICVVWRMLLLLGPPWGCFVFLCPSPHQSWSLNEGSPRSGVPFIGCHKSNGTCSGLWGHNALKDRQGSVLYTYSLWVCIMAYYFIFERQNSQGNYSYVQSVRISRQVNNTAWMLAVLPKFRSYILVPSPGLKWVVCVFILSRVLVSINGVPVGNWIYPSLTNRNYS